MSRAQDRREKRKAKKNTGQYQETFAMAIKLIDVTEDDYEVRIRIPERAMMFLLAKELLAGEINPEQLDILVESRLAEIMIRGME